MHMARGLKRAISSSLKLSTGGTHNRTNINARLLTSLPNGGISKNQEYSSKSHFDVHTNFTFLPVNSVNRGQIRQEKPASSQDITKDTVVLHGLEI